MEINTKKNKLKKKNIYVFYGNNIKIKPPKMIISPIK